jgi:hypothetical protein
LNIYSFNFHKYTSYLFLIFIAFYLKGIYLYKQKKMNTNNSQILWNLLKNKCFKYPLYWVKVILSIASIYFLFNITFVLPIFAISFIWLFIPNKIILIK